MFQLSKKSISNMQGVHPDLVRVVNRAITLSKIDFGVSEGLRTHDRQIELFNDHKSTTMNSMHLAQKHTGYSHAVDLFCFDFQGNVTWEHQWFRLIVQAMFTAAILENVQITAGGLWRTFLDSPHFQLDKDYY